MPQRRRVPRLTDIPEVVFSDLPPKPYQAPIPYVPPEAVNTPTTNKNGTRRRKETPQASYAFHLFAALSPEERTYQRVFDILVQEGRLGPKSRRLVEEWGAKWKWQERVKLIDAMRWEERHKEWEAARIKYHEDIADATGKAFDQVASFLEAKLASGRMNTEAAVQLYKIAADLKHRAYQELTERKNGGNQTGIQIVIETDASPTTQGPTINAQARVYDLTPRALPKPQYVQGPDGEEYAWDDDLPFADEEEGSPRYGTTPPSARSAPTTPRSPYAPYALEGDDPDGEDTD